jgi:hypothetical protein
MTDTYQKNMTLEEIQANDLEMTRDAIKNAKKYSFGHDMKKAVNFVRDCLGRTLVSLGMTHPQPPPNVNSYEARIRHAAKIDKAMREKQVKVEHRNKYRGNDMWRCGLYVYLRDELVAFISDVLTVRQTEYDPISQKIGNENVGFIVITNAQLEDTKRIFLVPGFSKGN